MPNRAFFPGRRTPQAGFSLIELLITLGVFTVVTAGLLVVFDNSGRLARNQTQVAIMKHFGFE